MRIIKKSLGWTTLGLLVSTLLSSCTVNVKHSTSKTETKKETQGPTKPTNPFVQKTHEPQKSQKQKTKNFESTDQSPQTTDWVVYRSVVIEKDTLKAEDFEKKESFIDKREIKEVLTSIHRKLNKLNILDNLDKRFEEIKEIIRGKKAKELVAF